MTRHFSSRAAGAESPARSDCSGHAAYTCRAIYDRRRSQTSAGVRSPAFTTSSTTYLTDTVPLRINARRRDGSAYRLVIVVVSTQNSSSRRIFLRPPRGTSWLLPTKVVRRIQIGYYSEVASPIFAIRDCDFSLKRPRAGDANTRPASLCSAESRVELCVNCSHLFRRPRAARYIDLEY